MKHPRFHQPQKLLGVLAAALLIFLTVAGTWTGGITPAEARTRSTRAAATATPVPTPIPTEPAALIDPQAIADYLDDYGELPENFITKSEAKELGWDSRYNCVSDVAPGKSIGGDRFGNYEGQLPKAKGRQYYECDCWYEGGRRNAYRLIFSSDGLYYYTEDHYNTFTEMHPEPMPTAEPEK